MARDPAQRDDSRAASALRESVARQEAIFAAPLIGIITLNESGSIESLNAAAARMFGCGAAAVARRDFGCLVDLGGGGISAAARLRDLAAGGGEVRELVGRRQDGSAFPVDFALAEMPLGERRMFVVFVRDISQRRRSERLKDEFVATVSHELRTPLTSIAGSLALLIGGAAGALPASAARLLDIAHSNSQRLVRLINNILDVEKMESGTVAFDFAAVDLRGLIEQAIEANRGFADSFGIRVQLDPRAATGTVRVDSDRIIQVVTNLISNAVKFSPVGAEVEVAIESRDAAMRVLVRDHGPGVPEGFKPRIFEKFAQASPADGPRRGGSGLGLNIVRQIVEHHGGNVSFTAAPGGGAIFYFDLPRLPDCAVPAAEAPAALTSGERPRVLHVDDDRDVLHVVAETLRADADVISASSITEARRALVDGDVDLAVVDLGLADGAGLELLAALRNSDGEAIPAIVFSGQDATPGMAEKVDAVLTKSRASLDRLLAILRRMSAQGRLARRPRSDAARIAMATGREVA